MRKLILWIAPICLVLLSFTMAWAHGQRDKTACPNTSCTCQQSRPSAEQTQADINAAVEAIRRRTQIVPKVAVVLGSGFGSIAKAVTEPTVIPYSQIPNFPVSTAEGHAGQLVIGYIEGCPVVVMSGRVHYYEGYAMSQVVFPIRVLHALGATTAIFTNASGGINPALQVGDLMMLNDHINLMGTNPLLGPNSKALGPRFFPLAGAYTAKLQVLAREIAAQKGFRLNEGVYCALTGPSYETPAEFHMLQRLGVDAVGMSTVPEVIAAAHCGMDILAISCVTDVPHYGPGPSQQTNHQAVLEAANRACTNLEFLVRGVAKALK